MRAITQVLRSEGASLDDLELVVCGRSITSAWETLVASLPLPADRVVEPPLPSHHLAHAYSAYYSAPFEEPAVLVIDEQGHWIRDRFEKMSWFTGDTRPLKVEQQFWGSATSLSIGMFYNIFAAMVGLSEAGRPAAGKLMSLAAYAPTTADQLQLGIQHGSDTVFDLHRIDHFLGESGLQLRPGGAEIAIRGVDDLLLKYRPVHWTTNLAKRLANTAQHELEMAVLRAARGLQEATGRVHLALAGGVALNCTVNARLNEVGFEDVHVHPAATDDGTAVGLAFLGWTSVLGMPRTVTTSFSASTGPRYTRADIADARKPYPFDDVRDDVELHAAADIVVRGGVLAWFHGGSEWGPRALGHRSLVANPNASDVVSTLNARVKHREAFRPFGVSVVGERVDELIVRPRHTRSLDGYMLSVGTVRSAALADVAHVDGSIRFQVVWQHENPMWHSLIRRIGDQTGTYAVVNTSFNTFGEPLVETPRDALRQLILSGVDALWMEGQLFDLAASAPSRLKQLFIVALEQSEMDAVQIAAGLYSSGYSAAARRVLAEGTKGADEVQLRQREDWLALQCVLALDAGDNDSAESYGAAVLRRWRIPGDVQTAARALLGSRESSVDCRLAAVIAGLGSSGSAYDMLADLLAPPERTELASR
ncbi:MAG: carbamoyltransferase C-terminal domain-containing protein [Jatrophihabitans sp.]